MPVVPFRNEEVVNEKRAHLQELFVNQFGEGAPREEVLATRNFVMASAPGRMEVAGNHVDHQGGCVISAAIGERVWCLAAENGTSKVRVFMEGFGLAEIDLADETWVASRIDERGFSISIIRGMLSYYEHTEGGVTGFDMVVCSDIPVGVGVSSSAAFENMLGAAFKSMFCPCSADEEGFVPIKPLRLANHAVSVERHYYGKPCGAQDQIATAVGGVVRICFKDELPELHEVEFDPEAAGYQMFLIDSRQDHAPHTDEFASIPSDMRTVANYLGVSRLGDTTVEVLLENFSEVRKHFGDLCAMRALHYYDEVARVKGQFEALKAGDFSLFLQYVRLSGGSSAMYLQNVSLSGEAGLNTQPPMTIMALCAHLLGAEGAWRIHGGGFGGSILAFVPTSQAASFKEALNEYLGYKACHQVMVGGPGVVARRLG
jgi:galactokinase